MPQAFSTHWAVGRGLTLYMDNGQLVYEYNMMIIERTIVRSNSKLPPASRPSKWRPDSEPEAAVARGCHLEGRWQ